MIDARVADYQSLLADLPANVTVRVIQGNESGLQAVGEELARAGRFDAVHVLSHGSAGSVTLGSDTLDRASLARQGAQVQAWAAHLSAGADILLYGCDVAGGAQGQAFIAELARITVPVPSIPTSPPASRCSPSR